MINYENIQIVVVQKPEDPNNILALALQHTMYKDKMPAFDPKTIEFLIKAEHTSVFEHIAFTLDIREASRALMSQITRHRIASYTISSQHYQKYSNYEDICSPRVTEQQYELIKQSVENSAKAYEKLLAIGTPREEARMILPNTKTVNILMTINCRSLISFLRQRMCHRNVLEMRIVAEKIYCVLTPYWPEFFNLIGPYCYMGGRCNQGKMSCGDPCEKRS
jgi:thymidylate synthase (FAD)